MDPTISDYDRWNNRVVRSRSNSDGVHSKLATIELFFWQIYKFISHTGIIMTVTDSVYTIICYKWIVFLSNLRVYFTLWWYYLPYKTWNLNTQKQLWLTFIKCCLWLAILSVHCTIRLFLYIRFSLSKTRMDVYRAQLKLNKNKKLLGMQKFVSKLFLFHNAMVSSS